MQNVTIKDLLDVIHLTIIKNKGDNSTSLEQIKNFYSLLNSGEIENFGVQNTELWQTILRMEKKSGEVKIYY